MKTPTLLNIAIALSTTVTVVTGQVSPATAQTTPETTEQPNIETLTQSQPQPPTTPRTNLLPQPTTVTIPASTGVIVSFLSPVSIDAGEAAYPMTLPLSQAITDSRGHVVAPENSPVSVVIQPEEGGARVIAQSIVIGGQIIPIQATSPIIPGSTITHMRANDRAANEGATFGRIAASGFGFFNGGDPDAFDRGAMLGNLVGMVSGRRDESTRVVQIPQGSVYVLALENAITLGR